MNFRASSLGIFVPGHFTIPPQPAGLGSAYTNSQIASRRGVRSGMGDSYLSAAGTGTWTTHIGDLSDSYFSASWPGLAEFVDAKFTIPPQPAGIGDFVGGKFTLPQNPFLITNRDLATEGALAGLGCGGCGGDCGCDSCSHGMGFTIGGFDSSQLTSYTVFGIPVIYLAGGALLLMFAFGSGSSGARAARATAKARYREKLAEIGQKYSVRGRAKALAGRIAA